MDELSLVDWLRGRLRMGEGVALGPGDDCALLDASRFPALAATADTLLEGTHFLPDSNPRAVGWKTCAVNLSDLAAMGCRPLWALTGLGLRRSAPANWAREFGEGLAACAEKYKISLVGGDITSGEGPTSITLTAIGTPFPGGPVRRAGARPGDAVVVTGRLGGSILGRHLEFEPRLPESEWLCATGAVHAMMDLSDGLSLDLRRLCRESKVGARIQAEWIPVSAAATDIATRETAAAHSLDMEKQSQAELLHALGDGEDFELLCAIDPLAWVEIGQRWPFAEPLSCIGFFTAPEAGLILVDKHGESPLPEGGYVHGFAEDRD